MTIPNEEAKRLLDRIQLGLDKPANKAAMAMARLSLGTLRDYLTPTEETPSPDDGEWSEMHIDHGDGPPD